MLNKLNQWLVHAVTSKSSIQRDAHPSAATIQLSILTQFYPPDFAATGQFVDELAQQLSHQHIDVQVFTGQPGYAFDTTTAPDVEQMGRVLVRRSRLLRSSSRKFAGRTISSLAFCGHAIAHLCKREHRGDILLLTSEPPFLQVVGYLIHKLFKTPYVSLVYDLYPEVAVELNVVSQHHWLVRLWDLVNRRVWRRADAIIVPCQTMKDRIIAKVPEVARKITVIHNWADPTWIKPLAKNQNEFAHRHNLVKPFTVLYSGNMGRCHDMDTILNAAGELRHEPVQFVFIGGGPKREACVQRAEEMGLTNCLFLPYQDKVLLPQSLTACDLSLVSVDVGMEGLVAPSKFYSALSSGRPVAVICEKHSYLRSLVADANCGAAFRNGDSKGLAGFIRYLATDPEMTERLGRSGHRYIYEYFTPTLISKQYFKILQRAVVQNADLRQAVEQDEFQVYYQPILSLRTSQIIGFEALIRWQHPIRGLICPAEFMAAAEETGLIVSLGWWMLNQVCQQLSNWRSQFPNLPLRISVNLSSQQFFHPDLIPYLDEHLNHYRLDGRCLALEISDRTVMEDAASTTANLLQLQTRQIQVCIDDFGASHTSLQYVHRFPIGALKIDRSLVTRIGMDLEAVKLIETIVILARDLSMELTAEGIETVEQLRRLKEIGFITGQGHLYSKPVDAETAETLLRLQPQASLINPPSPSLSSELAGQSTPADTPMILVIDDDRSMRTLLRGAIAKEGYRVVEAANGEQGLEIYQHLRPNLVLLDGVMPEMDGFTCCTQLRQMDQEYNKFADATGAVQLQLKACQIPVLMITALDDTESVDKAFAVGATDYITKPINWPLLRQRLRQLLILNTV